MQTFDLDQERLRALATTRVERGKVLSLYLNLDPHEFPTQRERESAATSVLDEARRAIESDSHAHAERAQLREDLETARATLRSPPANGAHGLAVFVCGVTGLHDVIRIPRPVPSGHAIAVTPQVAPLAELYDPTTWGILLVNRRTARVLRGTRDALAEVTRAREDWPGRDHDIGPGDPRYERTVQQEVEDHLHVAADMLFAEFRREAFDALLVGAPDDLPGRLEAHLHPYLRERLAGQVAVDVDVATPDAVLTEAQGPMEERHRAHLGELLGRLRDNLGMGERASAGWVDVLAALNERRVEALLLGDGPQAGVRCPACGWLGAEGESCPVDATATERCVDVGEVAVEAAIAQDAEVARVEPEDLAGLGGVGAVHRF